jgi:hypothetical protein
MSWKSCRIGIVAGAAKERVMSEGKKCGFTWGGRDGKDHMCDRPEDHPGHIHTCDCGVGKSSLDPTAWRRKGNSARAATGRSEAEGAGMMATLEQSIEAGKALGKMCLYFGCLRSLGHFLHDAVGRHVRPSEIAGFPWDEGLLDTGLLLNGKRPDVVDGKVYWTCCGANGFWYAFYWWDRSVDKRGNSNSGFYVRGFGHPEADRAFEYACEQFPAVVSRQARPLVLQNPRPSISAPAEQP